MINKRQIIVFVVSFLIVGFFHLSTPESGFSGSIPGGPPCCFIIVLGDRPVCVGGEGAEARCEASACETQSCTFFNDRICVPLEVDPDLGTCDPPPSQIPTLNQWGTTIMTGVLGLFAVIGIFAMRRRSAVTS